VPNQTIEQVDVRGPRFAAWVTTGVVTVALLASALSPKLAAVLLAVQAVVFAVGAAGGPRKHPYGRLFARFVAQKLGPATEREPVPPLKFAQLVGFVFAVAGTVGFATGLHVVGLVAAAFALIAAFLNAAFGVCLGCQLHPLVARLRRTPDPA
jgi:hypothetical protein